MKRIRIVGVMLVAAVCTLLVGMMALVGCAGDGANSKSTLTPEIVSEIGAYKATANNAGENSAVMSGNAVEAKEGQIIVISANLEEGSFSVELSSESLKQPITKEVSGQAIEVCEVDPGKYGVGVTCASEGTTGSVLICPVDAAEFEKQNQDLDATLAAMAAAEAEETSGSSVAPSASEAADPGSQESASEESESSSETGAAEAAASSSAASAEEASYTVDYGTSELYTKEDMDAAVDAIMAEFDTWNGAVMKSIAFTDDATCEDNVAYANELREEEDAEFDQAIVFSSSFHSPSGEDSEETAWEPDTDYDSWTWTLARSEGGEWKLLTWGNA